MLGVGACHVFAGEETRAVAFSPMLRALPSEAPVFGVVEVDEPGDRLPLPRALRLRMLSPIPAVARLGGRGS